MSLLSVQNLGKAFRSYRSEWQRFARWFGMSTQPSEEHWILRNINFEIQPGEAIGIIGQNGAGKSTLLKMITGTLQPTEGEVQINGRIAAILELGMGFNPELTGRQNVLYAAGLMGFNAEQIQQVMPNIEEFAEIGEYFDEPVRTYSTGMQMRVAFSVATAHCPEILIVDEALAVGDIFFQQKCFDRIREYQEQGTALLFVSHALDSVYSLCDRAIMISDGCITMDDKPKAVIDYYNASIIKHANPKNSELEISSGPDVKSQTKIGQEYDVGSYLTEGVVIESVNLYMGENKVESIISESIVTLRIRVSFTRNYSDPHVGFQIRNSLGEVIFMTTTHGMKKVIGNVKKGNILEVQFTFSAALMEGQYSLTVGIANGGMDMGRLKESLTRKQNAYSFSVLKNLESISWTGVYNLSPSCEFSLYDHINESN